MPHWRPSVDPMVPVPDLSFGDPGDSRQSWADAFAEGVARRPIEAPPAANMLSPLAAFLSQFVTEGANTYGARRYEGSPRNPANRLALSRVNLERQKTDKARAEQDAENRTKAAKEQQTAEEKRRAFEKEQRKVEAEALREREGRPGTPEYDAARVRRAQAMRDELEDTVSIHKALGLPLPSALRAEKTKPPSGMMVDEEGNIVPKPQTPKGAEKSALAFYLRAQDAVNNIETPDENGTPLEQRVGLANIGKQTRLRFAPDAFKSKEQRLYRQAQRAFTEARLRKESGAAIPDTEYENDSRIYFAQPGDDPATLQQKKNARQIVLDGLANSAGPAYDEWFGEPYPRKPRSKASEAGRTLRQHGVTRKQAGSYLDDMGVR